MQQVPPGCLIWYSDKSALTLAGCGKYSKQPHTVKWADNISAVNQISFLFTNITMTTVELVQACSVQATSSREMFSWDNKGLSWYMFCSFFVTSLLNTKEKAEEQGANAREKTWEAGRRKKSGRKVYISAPPACSCRLMVWIINLQVQIYRKTKPASPFQGWKRRAIGISSFHKSD